MFKSAMFPMIAKVVKIVLAVTLLSVVGYFYSAEFKKYPFDISKLKQNVNAYYLMLALLLAVMSYLLDVFIWKLIINGQPGRKEITSKKICAIFFASGLLKYLPGRIWTCAAQFMWLKKYGIARALVIYINVVCTIELIIVSLYFGLLYMTMYTNNLSVSVIAGLFASLLLANILFNCYSSALINRLFVLVKRIIKTEIPPIKNSFHTMVVIQFMVSVSWILIGLATYCLAKGVGLQIVLTDTIPVIASMSLSWLAGYLAVVSPGGLGIREGLMLLMLKPALVVQTALLLPILSRMMLLVAEALLGLLALFFGIRHNIFSVREDDGVL